MKEAGLGLNVHIDQAPNKRGGLEDMDKPGKSRIREDCRNPRSLGEKKRDIYHPHKTSVGRKRSVEERDKSPSKKGPSNQTQHVSSIPDTSGHGPLTTSGLRLKEKRIKSNEEGSIGSLIKSDNFLVSPSSPYLKLKELARRKGTRSLGINIETNQSNMEVQILKEVDNCSMAEEAGLTMPLIQP